MKILSKKIFAGLIIALMIMGGIFSFGAIRSSAQFTTTSQTQYVPLVSLGSNITGCDIGANGQCTQQGQGINFVSYIIAIVKVIIAAAGVIAVAQITIGGFEYIVSTDEPGKAGGKERIQNALIGLALALCSWLILYTINPQLIDLSLFQSDANGSTNGVQNTGNTAQQSSANSGNQCPPGTNAVSNSSGNTTCQ